MPTPRQIERRQRVLRISRELFSQQGYQETTLDQIAKQARIGKGIIYRYFGNKEDLLVAVFADSVESIRSAALSVRPVEGGDAGKMVEHILRNYLTQIEEQKEIFAFFGKILLGLPATPWGQGLRHDFMERYLEIVMRRKNDLYEAMKRGAFIQADPEKVMFCILGALNGIIWWWIQHGCPPGLAKEAEGVADFVLRGILSETHSPARAGAAGLPPRQ